MFTGIIENTGVLKKREEKNGNFIFQIEVPHFAHKLGESIAINGACLTVIDFDENCFSVEAIPETLKLTNLGETLPGDQLNLEKSLQTGATLDGHFVLGHIDFKTKLLSTSAEGDSQRYWFELPANFQKYIAKKGSVCLNGVSLTISDVHTGKFEVCLIPYTLEKTNLSKLQPGSFVNIEIDIVARYLERQLQFMSKS